MLHQLGTTSFLDKSGIVRDNLSARLPDLNEPNPADATSRREDSPLFPTTLAQGPHPDRGAAHHFAGHVVAIVFRQSHAA